MEIISPEAAKKQAQMNTQVSDATLHLLNNKIVETLEKGEKTLIFDVKDIKEQRTLAGLLRARGYKVKEESSQRDGDYLHINIP